MWACLGSRKRGTAGTAGRFPGGVGLGWIGLVVTLAAAPAWAEPPEFAGLRRSRPGTAGSLNAASSSPRSRPAVPSRQTLPPPVQAAPVESLPAAAGWGLWQRRPPAPHVVLRPHRRPSFPAADPRAASAVPPRPTHPHHLPPEHVTGARPAIQEAATRYRRKVPYSYGYFGAQAQRHWSLHHGHQQDRIEWVLR